MMRPWDPHGQTFQGTPIAGAAPPRLVVYGAHLTPQQAAMLQAAYVNFHAMARLSVAPNPAVQGRLPDGSAYTIDCIGPICTCAVWPVKPGEEDVQESGVLVMWQSGAQLLKTLFVPGGEFADPDGTWKAKNRNRKYAGDQSLWEERPRYVGESWHSPTSAEYYVDELNTRMERAGSSAIQITYTLPESGTICSAVMALNVNDEKRFCQLYRSNTKAYMIHGQSVDTSKIRKTPQNVTIANAEEIADAPAGGYITALSPSPSGMSALVTSVKYNSLAETATPLPFKGQRRIGPYKHYAGNVYYTAYVLEQVNLNDIYATEHNFNEVEWTEGDEFFRAEFGDCEPLSNYVTDVNGSVLYHSGGITRKILEWPEWWLHPNIGASCDYPADAMTSRMLIRSLAGTVRGTESQSFDSGDVLQSGDGYEGAWYAHDGTRHVMPTRSTHEYDMAFTSSVDEKVYGKLSCGPSEEWSDEVTDGTRTETGTAQHALHRKVTTIIAGDEFILSELTVDESINYEMLFSQDYSEATDFANYQTDLATVIDVEYVMRRILVVDPQFGLVCFVEAQYAFQRTASSVYTSVQPHAEDDPVASYVGGDTASPPSAPQGYVVIEINGVEAFREAVASNRDDESPPIFVDCEHPWVYFGGRSVFYSPAGQFMNMESVYGTETNVSLPFFYSLGTGESPLSAAGTSHVTTDYAKDPKTGGGVLIIKSAFAGLAKAYVVDHRGINPATDVFSSLAVTPNTEVAAT